MMRSEATTSSVKGESIADTVRVVRRAVVQRDFGVQRAVEDRLSGDDGAAVELEADAVGERIDAQLHGDGRR